MSHLIGRRGHGRETYPKSAAAGGGAAAIPPLSRQWFIDGGTATIAAARNGAISTPFATMQEFLTARGNHSAADALSPVLGWVTPNLAGYTENLSFPAYASTELRSESFSLGAGVGVTLTGNVNWNNFAGAFTPAAASMTIHNISVIGNITINDDANAPQLFSLFGGDEILGVYPVLIGNFVANTTTKLLEATFSGCNVQGNIDCGTAVDSAAVTLLNAETLAGAGILGRAVRSIGSEIGAAVITCASGGTASFLRTFFQNESPLLTADGGATFDGDSWQSFQYAGGTRGPGTAVTVFGGYDGGEVPGADLPTGAVTTSVSLDGGSASAGYTGENSGNHYSSSGLVGNGIVQLENSGAKKGDTLLITKKDVASFTLRVQNAAAGLIATIPADARGFVLSRFDGAAWVFDQGGSLA